MVLVDRFFQMGMFIKVGMFKANHKGKENTNGKMEHYTKASLLKVFVKEKDYWLHQIDLNFKGFLKSS